MTEDALKINDLTKIYPVSNGQSVKALDNVSLNIQKGEIFGLLGPNGAGKTTLINCCLSIVPMTHGTVRIFGYDAVREYTRARSKVGFVYQEVTLDNFFSSKWMLHFHRGFYGRKYDPVYVEKLLRDLDLWQHRQKKPDQLSGGMKRRLALAQALVHKPDLVFLDEPTAGVDIELREKTWQIIRDINRQGTTILLTTHYIEEAEMMCDRIGIINHGRFLKIAHTQLLVREMGQRRMIVYLKTALSTDQIRDLPYKYQLNEQKVDGMVGYEIFIDRGYESVKTCLSWFQSKQIPIEEIDIRPGTLQDVFRSLAWGDT